MTPRRIRPKPAIVDRPSARRSPSRTLPRRRFDLRTRLAVGSPAPPFRLAPFGPAVADWGAPKFLFDPHGPLRFLEDFGDGNGVNGTGFHLEDGFVLTAR